MPTGWMDNLTCTLNAKSSSKQMPLTQNKYRWIVYISVASRFHSMAIRLDHGYFFISYFSASFTSFGTFFSLSLSLHCRLKNDNADCIDYIRIEVEPSKMKWFFFVDWKMKKKKTERTRIRDNDWKSGRLWNSNEEWSLCVVFFVILDFIFLSR